MLPRLIRNLRQRLSRRHKPPSRTKPAAIEALRPANGYSCSLADQVFTFDIAAEPLASHDLLRYKVAAGRILVTINTMHPAASLLLDGETKIEIPTSTAMMCAALVALEVETTNPKRRSFYHDAREDLGRLLRKLRPVSKITQ